MATAYDAYMKRYRAIRKQYLAEHKKLAEKVVRIGQKMAATAQKASTRETRDHALERLYAYHESWPDMFEALIMKFDRRYAKSQAQYKIDRQTEEVLTQHNEQEAHNRGLFNDASHSR